MYLNERKMVALKMEKEIDCKKKKLNLMFFLRYVYFVNRVKHKVIGLWELLDTRSTNMKNMPF